MLVKIVKTTFGSYDYLFKKREEFEGTYPLVSLEE
jgi:hypothetical protein